MSFSLSNTAAGASAGSIFGPAGTIVGGAAGLLADLWTGFSSSRTEAKATKLEYQAQAEALGGQILQTKSDITSYEEFLAALPNQQALRTAEFEAASREEFSGLLNTLGMQDAAAGASDRSGLSVSAVAGEALGKLTAYAGADQTLGGEDGGIYSRRSTQLANEQAMEKNQATRQLDVFKQALPTLEKNQAKYEKMAGQVRTDAWGAFWGIGR